MPLAKLPPDVAAVVAAAESIVDEDSARMSETADSLDAIPDELFDAPSVVRAVEAVRTTTRTAARAARESAPPALRAKGA